MALKLTDSNYIKGLSSKNKKLLGNQPIISYCNAIDKLDQEINNNQIDFFSLGGNIAKLDEKLIWYQIDSIENFSRTQVIREATFFTTHYIGFYSTTINKETINISIKPRFGDKIFNHLLSYAYGIYLPKGTSSSSSNKSNSLWLIAIMWKATLEKAMTKSQIPKEYQKQNKNLDTFKGQLNISKHIQHNLFDKSKFYCNYRKLTMDTVINQTIRYTYKLLEKKGYGNLLKDIAEYNQMLQSFGVQSKIVLPSEIKNIRYLTFAPNSTKIYPIYSLRQ